MGWMGMLGWTSPAGKNGHFVLEKSPLGADLRKKRKVLKLLHFWSGEKSSVFKQEHQKDFFPRPKFLHLGPFSFFRPKTSDFNLRLRVHFRVKKWGQS